MPWYIMLDGAGCHHQWRLIFLLLNRNRATETFRLGKLYNVSARIHKMTNSPCNIILRSFTDNVESSRARNVYKFEPLRWLVVPRHQQRIIIEIKIVAGQEFIMCQITCKENDGNETEQGYSGKSAPSIASSRADDRRCHGENSWLKGEAAHHNKLDTLWTKTRQ